METFTDRHLLRKVAAIAAVVQVFFALLLYVRGGFPIFGDSIFENAAAWERPLAILNAPGVQLLTAAGLCCGYRSHLVIGDVFIGGHATMSPVGPIILGIANLLICVPLIYVVVLLTRRIRDSGVRGAA